MATSRLMSNTEQVPDPVHVITNLKACVLPPSRTDSISVPPLFMDMPSKLRVVIVLLLLPVIEIVPRLGGQLVVLTLQQWNELSSLT